METKKLEKLFTAIILILVIVGESFAYELKDFTGKINITQEEMYINKTYNMTGIKVINVYSCNVNNKYYGYWHPLTTKTSKIALYVCGNFTYNILEHELKHHFSWLVCGNKCFKENINHKGFFNMVNIYKEPYDNLFNNNPTFYVLEYNMTPRINVSYHYYNWSLI